MPRSEVWATKLAAQHSAGSLVNAVDATYVTRVPLPLPAEHPCRWGANVDLWAAPGTQLGEHLAAFDTVRVMSHSAAESVGASITAEQWLNHHAADVGAGVAVRLQQPPAWILERYSKWRSACYVLLRRLVLVEAWHRKNFCRTVPPELLENVLHGTGGRQGRERLP